MKNIGLSEKEWSGAGLAVQQGVGIEEDTCSRESEKLGSTILRTSHQGLEEQYPRRTNYCAVTDSF